MDIGLSDTQKGQLRSKILSSSKRLGLSLDIDNVEKIVNLVDIYSKQKKKFKSPPPDKIKKELVALSNRAEKSRNLFDQALQREIFTYFSHSHDPEEEPYLGSLYRPEFEKSLQDIQDILHELKIAVEIAQSESHTGKATPPGMGMKGAFILDMKMLLSEIEGISVYSNLPDYLTDCIVHLIKVARPYLELSLPSDSSLRQTVLNIGLYQKKFQQNELEQPGEKPHWMKSVRETKDKIEFWSTANNSAWFKGKIDYLIKRAKEYEKEGCEIEQIAEQLNLSTKTIEKYLDKSS